MTSNILFNTCINQQHHKHSQLLALISSHPSFKSSVNQYYQILNQQPTSSSLTHLGTLAFALLLPEYPLKHKQILAEQLLESIQTHDQKYDYNKLKEYLLKICSYAVENIDVRSAIGFL